MTDPDVMRQSARGDAIARAHDRCADIIPCGLDHAQRSRLADVLAQVWDDGFRYALLVLEPVAPAEDVWLPGDEPQREQR